MIEDEKDSLRRVQQKLVNHALNLFCISMVFTVLVYITILNRNPLLPDVGERSILLGIQFGNLILCAMTLFKHKISYSVKAGFLCGFVFVEALISIATMGVVSAGFVLLLIDAIMAFLLLGHRTVIIMVLIAISFIFTVVTSHVYGTWQYPEIKAYVNSPWSWFTNCVALISMGPIVFMGIRLMQRHYVDALKSVVTAQRSFENLFRHAPIPTLLVNDDLPQFTIVHVNREAESLLDYPPDALVGKPIRHLFFEQQNEKWHELIVALMRGGTATNHLEVTANSGEIIPVLINTSFSTSTGVSDENRQIIVTMDDLRAREIAERAIRESEKKYRELFNAGNDAIIVINVDDERVIEVNDAMLRMYACTSDEITGKTLAVLNAAEPRDSTTDLMRYSQAALSGEPQNFEMRARALDGRIFWVEINMWFSTIGGQKRFILFIRDIEEKKRSNELLIQSEKMISVGRLSAGIAHEINNPLAGIIQSAYVLQQRLSSNGLEANLRAAKACDVDIDKIAAYNKQRGIPELAENIHSAARRASEIVANMLGFARKSEQQVTFEDVNNILRQTITLAQMDYDLGTKYDFRHIDIETRYKDGLPAIHCQSGKLQQVFFNILKNGAEAMYELKRQKETRFTLETAVNYKTGMISVLISDNGPGIPPEVLRHVFDPFFTTKPPGKGTGLGLSLAYRIIAEEHGGTLEVKSTPGEGATFIIMLPFAMETTSPHSRNTAC